MNYIQQLYETKVICRFCNSECEPEETINEICFNCRCPVCLAIPESKGLCIDMGKCSGCNSLLILDSTRKRWETI